MTVEIQSSSVACGAICKSMCVGVMSFCMCRQAGWRGVGGSGSAAAQLEHVWLAVAQQPAARAGMQLLRCRREGGCGGRLLSP